MESETPTRQTMPAEVSINQHAGAHATQIGQVDGIVNIYNYYAESGETEDRDIDLAAYRAYLQVQFARWKQQYTLLDVNPVVSLVGQDLKPIPNAQISILQCVQEYARLIIIGNAGSGKTASLRFIAQSVAETGVAMSNSHDNVPLCLYLELGRFRMLPGKSAFESLLILIADVLYVGGAAVKPPSLGAVQKLLTNTLCLILFDGLNEMPEDLQMSVLQAINDLSQRYAQHRYVLTARPPRKHRFSPLQWNLVALKELEDGQIHEFLARYTDEHTAQELLQITRDAQNPLLRLPLFLHYLVQMRRQPLAELQTRIGSRAGMLAYYVQYLIQRDVQEKSLTPHSFRPDQIQMALHQLTQKIQHTGQSLPTQEVIAVMTTPSDNSKEAEQLLITLCECGLLVNDGRYVRFWHHTLQEYFYAGALVEHWRTTEKTLDKPPAWLRKLFCSSSEEEALLYITAYLTDQELSKILLVAGKDNPKLLIAWLDDLSAERRCPDGIEQSINLLHKISQKACRYAELSNFDFKFTWRKPEVYVIIYLFHFFIAKVYSPITRLEALSGAIFNIRSKTLKESMASITIAVNRFVDTMQLEHSSDIVSSLKNSSSLYTKIRMLGHVNDSIVFPLLQAIAKYGNVYSLAALHALKMRVDRFADERTKIKDLAWSIYQDTKIDWKLRHQARKLLLKIGEPTGSSWVIFRYVIIRVFQYLLLCLLLCLLLVLLFGLFALTGSDSGEIFSALVGILSWVIIMSDAKKIGARRIPGYIGFDSGEPWLYVVLTLGSCFILAPLYILNRSRIRRNATEIGWNAIDRQLRENSSTIKHDFVISVIKRYDQIEENIKIEENQAYNNDSVPIRIREITSPSTYESIAIFDCPWCDKRYEAESKRQSLSFRCIKCKNHMTVHFIPKSLEALPQAEILPNKETPGRKNHSRAGIIAFISGIGIWVVAIVCLIIRYVYPIQVLIFLNSESALGIFIMTILGGLFVSLIGLIFGIVGCVQKKRKRLFATLGLVFNAVIFIGIISLFLWGSGQ